MSGMVAGAVLASLFSQPSEALAQGQMSGIFSNVQLSPETGDLGGLEIEIHTDTAEPYALVVFCEGWCNQSHRVPIRLSGNSFNLAFTEPLRDSSGAPVAEDHYRLEGRLAGRFLLVDLQLGSHRWSMKLMRAGTRFGLDVAQPPSEIPPLASDAVRL